MRPDPAMRILRALPALQAAAALVITAAPIHALPGIRSAAAGINQCEPPAPGRYALVGIGNQGDQPVAVLLQERWLPGGRLEGVRFQRIGRRLDSDRYSGSYKAGKDCWVSIERRGPAGVMLSADTIDQQGRPQTGLVTRPNGVLSVRYVNQGETACSAEQLNGLVTSQQQGQSWTLGRWQPNAVVQREWWRAGQVYGVALSSYGGRIERVPYSGSLSLGADCLGQMQQRDGKGVLYNYKVLMLSRGNGYVYLQTDANDLTLGLLQHHR